MKLREKHERIKGFILGVIVGFTVFFPLIVYAKGHAPAKVVLSPKVKASVVDVQLTTLPKPETKQDTKTKQEVIELINKYSSEFGINAAIPLKIANCESGYNPNAKNKNSTASGVFQFVRSTWNGTPEGKQGLSPFDAEANVRAAIRKIAEGGIGAWQESKSCWNK